MALNPVIYKYLLSPTFQLLDSNGRPVTQGSVVVYEAGTSDTPYITYSNFDGSRNPSRIRTGIDGRCVAIADSRQLYDIYFYNRYGTLMFTRVNVSCEAGQASDFSVVSTDDTITVTRTGNTFDCSVNAETFAPMWGQFSIASTDTSGPMWKCNLNKDAGSMALDVMHPSFIQLSPETLYHVDLHMHVERPSDYNTDDIDAFKIYAINSTTAIAPVVIYTHDVDMTQNSFEVDVSFVWPTSSSNTKICIGYSNEIGSTTTPASWTVSGYIHIYDATNVNVGGGTDIDVDDELSAESENPVQNKVITTALSSIQASIPELEELDDNDVQTIWNNA